MHRLAVASDLYFLHGILVELQSPTTKLTEDSGEREEYIILPQASHSGFDAVAYQV